MRKFLLLFLLAGFCLNVAAQEKNEPVTIDVSGSAEVFVAPDEVIFSLDVTNVDKDLPKAKATNDETVAKVLALTGRFNVAPQDVKTDYISFDKEYEYFRDEKKKVYDEDGDEISRKTFKGYKISKTVIVKLKEIGRFEEFFSEILRSGITEINSVSFETSQLRELKDRARELAMKAAHEKAKAMAGAVGQTIGKAISIVEESTNNRGYSLSNVTSNSISTVGTFAASESMATFAPGAIKVEASVKVRFLLN
jgi:uncharacterized protein